MDNLSYLYPFSHHTQSIESGFINLSLLIVTTVQITVIYCAWVQYAMSWTGLNLFLTLNRKKSMFND